MSPTIDERVARLEAQREAEMKAADELTKRIDHVDKKIDGIDDKLDTINGKLDRQKGFVAGAMTVLTFFWGVIGAAGVALWNYFTSKGDLP